MGDVVLGDQIGAKGYDLFSYDKGSSIVCIMKRFEVVKSIIIGFNKFSWQLICKVGDPKLNTHIIHLFPKMRVITLTILALTSIVSAEDSYASQCDAVTGRIMERCTKQVRGTVS